MALLVWLIIGAITGWLAGKVLKGQGFGLLGDVFLGIVWWTGQAQSAGSVITIAAQATARALSVARTQQAMTADAANFPSTQISHFRPVGGTSGQFERNR